MRTADSIEETKAAKTLTPVSPEPKPKRKVHPNTLKALRPWVKGVSGNPGGRPKYDAAAALARAVIEGCESEAYKGLAKALMGGNAYVFKELAERGYGKLKEQHEIKHIHEDVPDTDLTKRVADLERDLGLAAAIDEAGRVGVAAAGAEPTNGKAKVADVLP